MFFAQYVLTLLGRGVGVFLDHIIRGGEDEFFGKDWVESVLFADCLFRVVEGLVDGFDGGFEVVDVAVFGFDVLCVMKRSICLVSVMCR